MLQNYTCVSVIHVVRTISNLSLGKLSDKLPIVFRKVSQKEKCCSLIKVTRCTILRTDVRNLTTRWFTKINIQVGLHIRILTKFPITTKFRIFRRGKQLHFTPILFVFPNNSALWGIRERVYSQTIDRALWYQLIISPFN